MHDGSLPDEGPARVTDATMARRGETGARGARPVRRVPGYGSWVCAAT